MDMNVRVAELQRIVQTNRDEHEALYAEAVEAYREQALSKLNEYIDDAKTGAIVRVIWALPFPEQHLDDYDRVLRMLELTVDDIVQLTDEEVAQFVMNDWQWGFSWAANTIAYTSRS